MKICINNEQLPFKTLINRGTDGVDLIIEPFSDEDIRLYMEMYEFFGQGWYVVFKNEELFEISCKTTSWHTWEPSLELIYADVRGYNCLGSGDMVFGQIKISAREEHDIFFLNLEIPYEERYIGLQDKPMKVIFEVKRKGH